MALTQISTAGVKYDAVTSGNIPANAVGSSELADNAVDTAAIVDGAVTAAKIATNTITADKIATNAVNTGEIVDGAVTADKIASQTITANKIAADAVGASELANSSVAPDNLQTNSVTTAKIANEAVTLAKLPHGTSSNDGKFLRANNGADPTFETVTLTTINSNADNNIITGTGTANTLQGQSDLTWDGTTLNLSANAPTITFTEGNADPDYKLIANAGVFSVTDTTNSVERLKVDTTGVQVPGTLKINDALEHNGDSDTKIRFPGADEVTVETGGQERFKVTSGGDVRLLSQNGNNADTNILYFRGGSSTQSANFAKIHSKMVSNWGGELYFQVKDDDGGLNNNYRVGMKIDADGRVTKPLTPSYFAYSSTSQTHANNTFINPGGWSVSGTGKHNIGNHFNTTNTTFTAPVDGRYFVSMQYSFWGQSDNSSHDGHQTVLFVNNTAGNQYFLQGLLANGAEGLVLGQAIVNLSANDTVRWKHDGYGGSGYYNIFTTFGYLLG